MIDEECLRELNDGLFGLRDSLDRRIRQLGDIRRAFGRHRVRSGRHAGHRGRLRGRHSAVAAAIVYRNWKMICAVTPARSKGLEATAGTKGVNFRQKIG